MPVQPPWTLDVETVIGVAITLLAVLLVQVVFRLRERQRSNRHHRGGRSLQLVGDLQDLRPPAAEPRRRTSAGRPAPQGEGQERRPGPGRCRATDSRATLATVGGKTILLPRRCGRPENHRSLPLPVRALLFARFGPSQRFEFARQNFAPLLGDPVGLLAFVVANVAGTLGSGKRPAYLIPWHAPLQTISNRRKRSWLTVLQRLQDSPISFNHIASYPQPSRKPQAPRIASAVGSGPVTDTVHARAFLTDPEAAIFLARRVSPHAPGNTTPN